jgi:hypothetical protein
MKFDAFSDSEEYIGNRTQAKINSQRLNKAIIDFIQDKSSAELLNSNLEIDQKLAGILKACSRALNCASKYILYRDDGSIENQLLEKSKYDFEVFTKYCASRSCLTCLRNKTADLINGYGFMREKELYFLTLTLKNCNRELLIQTIAQMISIMRKLQDLIRKNFKSEKFNGIRKLEITYNSSDNSFHPHFHIILDSEKIGDFLLNNWRSYVKKYFKDLDSLYSSKLAQDFKKCNDSDGEFLELCKYFTKLYKKDSEINISSFADIIAALSRIRIIQPFGNCHKNPRYKMSFSEENIISDYYIKFANSRYSLYQKEEISPEINQDSDEAKFRFMRRVMDFSDKIKPGDKYKNL